jgi:hypothetical protein
MQSLQRMRYDFRVACRGTTSANGFNSSRRRYVKLSRNTKPTSGRRSGRSWASQPRQVLRPTFLFTLIANDDQACEQYAKEHFKNG